MMDQIRETIAKFKERLLDLSARNSLINSKFLTRTTNQFRIVDELPDELYNKLSDGKKMYFESLPPMQDDPVDEKTKKFMERLEIERETEKTFLEDMEKIEREGNEDANQAIEDATRRLKDRLRASLNMPKRTTHREILKEHARRNNIESNYDLPYLPPGAEVPTKWKDKKIQTLLLPDSLKRQERIINRNFRSSLKESGVNPLFFAFGFLQWQEHANAERTLYSPLLLLQVDYSDDKKGKKSVQGTGDSLTINLTLSEKLKRDFGSSLPEVSNLNDDEELSELSIIEDYFEKVTKEVAKPNHWRVRRWVSFGIFKTLNMPIYEDLKRIENSSISEILKTLLVGGENPSLEPLADYEIDTKEVQDVAPMLVRSADASQHSAVVDVLRGKSLVIKGPPGTGKSQTITNIISSLMYDGKTVLFTAQKQAALDVVRNNLTECGLQDYVLEAFSMKASKRAVAQSMKERLEISKPQDPELIKTYLQRALQTKKNLNKYAELMGAKYGSGTQTNHEILWDIPDISATGTPKEIEQFVVLEPENIDKASLDSSLNDLDYLKGRHAELFKDISLENNRITTIKKLYTNKYSIKELKEKVENILDALQGVQKKKNELLKRNKSLSDVTVKTLADPSSHFQHISKFIEEQDDEIWLNIIVSPSISLKISEWIQREDSLKNREDEYNKIFIELSSQYHLDDRGFSKDSIRAAAVELKTTHLFSIFSGNWHKARAIFKDLRTEKNEKLRAREEGNELLKLHKFFLIQNTEEAEIKESRSKQNTLKQEIVEQDNRLDGFEVICEDHSSEEIVNLIHVCTKLSDSFRNDWVNLPKSVKSYAELLSEESSVRETALDHLHVMEVDSSAAFHQSPEDLDIEELCLFYEEISKTPISLEDYMNWVQTEKSIEDRGLSDFYQVFLASGLSIDSITTTYKWVVRNAQARDIYDKHSEMLSLYSGSYLEKLRKQLRDEERKITNLWEKQLASKIYSFQRNAPEGNSSSKVANKTEKNLVTHLVTKPKSRISVRQFFHKAHASILAHKPCTLMSPASVAQVLPLNQTYDVLVIDEASQMKPELALGSIARAKQIVIVGDECQLPPYTGFQAGIDDDSDDDFNDESILDMARTVFFPPRLLNRHYRSRHEDLIRFSNSEFYDNKLLIPPTANPEAKDRGIEYRYVSNGRYLSTDSGGINEKEAHCVVDEILHFMKTRKDESLGVVTMNAQQKNLLQELFDQRSQRKPEVLEYLSDWKIKDQGINEFFIKNLENVQGDERDVMMIGTLYGPNKDGHVFQRFTAFTSIHGWRRLNVLFTRAKNQQFLFASLKPSKIIQSTGRSRGVDVFEKYLGFAETKELQEGRASGWEVDNPFQQWAIDKINSFSGFSAEWEIGVAGFRIDIGVKHEECSGYVMAVETDGATYHGTVSARDRDYLRQQILEGHGWSFHRIWSTDWMNDPVGTKDKLKIALENRVEHLKDKQKHRDAKKIDNPPGDAGEQLDRGDDLSSDNKKTTSKPYIEADIADVIEVDSGLFYKREYLPHLRQAVQHIINVEGPISHEILVKRVRLGHGFAKAGAPIRDQIKKAIPRESVTTKFKGTTFYWPNDSEPATYMTAREPQKSAVARSEHRKVQELPPEEIKAIALIIKEGKSNLPKSEMAKKIVAFLQYSQCSTSMRNYIFDALQD